MQRTTIQTVARRRAALGTARAFSSSGKCPEGDSKPSPSPGGSPALARRVPMASSLGDIALPTGNSKKITPGPASFSNYRPDLATWASQTPNNSLSQRQATRRLQALEMEGVAPTAPESSGTPPILDVPIPAPGIWAKPQTREEKRAEMQAKWNVQKEKENEAQRARAAAYEAEGERRKKATEARRIELQRASEGKKQADLEASTRALQRKERIQEQNEERRKAEWDRLQTVQVQQEQEHRQEEEAIMKATPSIAYVPSIVTPAAAREELESLVAGHSPTTEASGAPITKAATATPLKTGPLESVLAARVQNLKERAGDYSAYLPSHFGVGRAPGRERILGHVAYAQLTLARTRGVSLDRRRGAVKIVERFAASKEVAPEA